MQTQEKNNAAPWDPLEPLPRARRWLWLALALLVCALQGPRFIQSLRPARTQGTDFFQEWASAHYLFEGVPVYSRLEPAVERYLGYHVEGDQLTIGVNAHPPTSVLLAAPFCVFDYPDAVLAWNVVSLAALGLSMWFVLRQLRVPWSLWGLAPLVTLLLLFDPLRQQVNQGQLNLFILLLIVGSWVSERSGRRSLAAALIGAAAAIKLFPGFLLLHFVLRRQWLAFGAGMVTLVALTGLTAAFAGPGAYRSYVLEVLPTLDQHRGGWYNCSLVGFFTRLFDPPSPSLSPVEQAALEAGAEGQHSPDAATPAHRETEANVAVDSLLVCLTKPLVYWPALVIVGSGLACTLVISGLVQMVWKSSGRGQEDLAFGLSIVAMLLVAPITWDHYLMLLLIPWALIWVKLPPSVLARGLFLFISVAVWLPPGELWPLVVPVIDVNRRPVYGPATPLHSLTLLSIHCYALLGMFVLLAWLWRRESQAQDAGQPTAEFGLRCAGADHCTRWAWSSSPRGGTSLF
jgi:hypothetical protein